MLPYTLVRDADIVWRRLRRIGKWIRRHKMRTFALIVGSWLTMSLLGGHAIMAFAADGEGIQSLPFLSSLNPSDSGGVDLLHYVFLPVDRGHPLTSPTNFFVTQIADPIWMANIVGLSWGMWFLQFLITMEWVTWLTTPLEAIFKLIADAIAQIGWLTTGLIIAGIIVTVAFFRGQVATGLTKMLISVSAFALAGTALANPVGLVTGPDGLLGKARDAGGAIAASIASGDSSLLNQAPSADVSKQIVTDSLLGQVMDAWVRFPAQEVAFGHILEGQCAETFNKVMMEVGPLETGGNKVLDAIKACDPAAGEYAMHPTIANAFSAGIATFGSQILNLLAVGLGVILLIAIGYSVFSVGKWMIANFAVVATFGYQAWWGGLVGTFIGVIGVALALIVVSGFLSIVASVMTAMSGIPGLSTIAQLGILDVFVLTMIGVLIWQWIKAKKAGERLSERLARLTGGSSSGPKSHPIRKTIGRVAERYIGNKISGFGSSSKAAPIPSSSKPPRPKPEPMTSTTSSQQALPPGKPMLALNASPTSGKTTMKEKTGKLLTTGASVGLAAATGGTSAAVLALSKEGGKYVLQRGTKNVGKTKDKGAPTHANDSQRSKSRTSETPGSPSMQRPTFTGFGRRIEVDKDGVSKIAPREAPHRGGVYRITEAPTPKGTSPAKPSTSHLRERLQKAAAGARRTQR